MSCAVYLERHGNRAAMPVVGKFGHAELLVKSRLPILATASHLALCSLHHVTKQSFTYSHLRSEDSNSSSDSATWVAAVSAFAHALLCG